MAYDPFFQLAPYHVEHLPSFAEELFEVLAMRTPMDSTCVSPGCRLIPEAFVNKSDGAREQVPVFPCYDQGTQQHFHRVIDHSNQGRILILIRMQGRGGARLAVAGQADARAVSR